MKFFVYFISFIVIISSCESQQNDQETESKKATWINNAFTSIESTNYPNIKGIAWWHENFDDARLRLDSSPEAVKTYKEHITSSFYKSMLIFDNQKLTSPISGLYHGAFPDFGGEESNVTQQRILDFETLIQKELAWVYFSDNWLDNLSFPYDEVTTIHQTGRTPFIRMMARSDFGEKGADPVYTMQNIIDKKFDTQLIAWANEAKNINYPLLVEFGTEVNGNWFPWNGEFNGKDTLDTYGNPSLADGPERFRDAYRHIIDLFRGEGVTNITWFFHVDAHSEPNEQWNSIENYYPGDDYIDWLGVSIYGPQLQSEDFETFSDILDEIYPKLTQLSNKPIAILEFAITEID